MRGRVLIVTSSAGIGAAAARQAAAEQAGWELVSEIGAECWIGDLTRPSSGESVVSQCVAKFGRVDALFNAAGLSGRRYGDGPADECTDGGWDRSVLETAPEPRHFATHAYAAAKGGVVAMSRSVAAYCPWPRTMLRIRFVLM